MTIKIVIEFRLYVFNHPEQVVKQKFKEYS